MGCTVEKLLHFIHKHIHFLRAEIYLVERSTTIIYTNLCKQDVGLFNLYDAVFVHIKLNSILNNLYKCVKHHT